MTECIIEELNSGNDQCLKKVVNYLEGKSNQYYQKLHDVFGSTEYFQEFQKCYAKSEVSEAIDHGTSPCEQFASYFLCAYSIIFLFRWYDVFIVTVPILFC